ncbi:MAG: DUF5691 domain-containing protein [Bacteroidia bacterium]
MKDLFKNMENELIQLALIGTERGGELPALPPSFLVADDASNEEKLLMAAALLSLQERAAFLPEKYEGELPELCEAETLPYMRQQSADLFVILLSTNNSQPLVQHFLEKMIEKGRILRPNLLPQLLIYGKNRKELHHLIANMIGKRGFWLANQNAEWSYIKKQASQANVNDWEEGTHQQRLAYLHQVRKQDAAAARELLEQTWSKEGLAQRLEFLEIFSEKLSKEDEVFLSHLLAERSRDIRGLVMKLLAQIPKSALQERMKKRLENILQIKTDSKGKAVFELNLPEKCTDEMEKDGIDAKSKGYPSVKSGWVAQMINCVPLNELLPNKNHTILAYIDIIQKSEWANILFPAFADSAVLHHTAAWKLALLEFWLKEGAGGHITREKIIQLVNDLSPTAFTSLAKSADKEAYKDKKVMDLFAFRKKNWKETDTEIALITLKEAVKTYRDKQPFHCPEMLSFIQQIVLSISENKIPYFTEVFTELKDHNANWAKEMNAHIQQLQLRTRIFVEVSQN